VDGVGSAGLKRAAGGKPSDTEFDAEPLRVSIEEIDRHGPGLLVDYRHPGGGQFVSWVE
jgi:hypothetical protein